MILRKVSEVIAVECGPQVRLVGRSGRVSRVKWPRRSSQ
jgi:hypothetical protein